jgi:tetratricopeptide (TPR) repeat protein
MRSSLALLLLLSLSSCVSAVPTPVNQPNDREWNLLLADYQWLQTLRNAAPAPPAGATRKQLIEIRLETFRKVETTYNTFMGKLDEYYGRTADPRAAQLMAREKIVMGDEYMNVLSRYDRAVDLYKAALQIDPQNADATRRLQEADAKRYVSMNAFATLKAGMKEDEVRRLLGLPREDWIKQVVQNSRVYSVWIYPKPDGGASAVYFDNGVVYHTNWNAAPAKN